ncbi:uncharacterized protein LOC116336929 [Contarinia nasturtii]|uniref:uncharacterized protein LOC116336929 n=1 Tax=Contarinia nasturtii TaxID=265458 RepID=UPI0012D39958|nr:uncharacterized protein LOC116336929 [Contarinia nasturtii]
MGFIRSDNNIIAICALLMCSTSLLSTTMATNLNLHMNLTDDLPIFAQPLVDILISDYFKVEQVLWERIQHRADNMLLQVFKNHERFFDSALDDSGSRVLTKSDVLTKDIIANIETLFQINEQINSITDSGRIHLKEQTLDRKSITEYSSHALKILKEASNLFDYATNDTLWENIITHFTNYRKNGDTVQSSHHVIYDLYRDIQSGFLKSYITAQMSYMILSYYNSGALENYSEQVDILRTTFQQRFSDLRQIATRFLKKSDKTVWKCDTIVNNVFSSYTEISNFLQGFVDNEANLNSDASCSGVCSNFRKTAHFQCQSGSLCDSRVNDHEQAKCSGIIRDCQSIDDSDVNICETGESNRRYNYIKYSDGRTAGNSKAICHGRLRAESWIRWFVQCSNCICLCDDIKSKRTERYISLREVVSNIVDNKIVTGVTLTKQNGIIHLAIAERTLLPYAQAEVTPDWDFYEPWKSSYEFFKIDDTNVEENVDYFTISYENRSINLDEVTVPKGSLVTGVRFRVTDAGHITLDVRATPFDFITGKLKDLTNSVWISNPNCGQTEITQHRPTNPLNHSNKLSHINNTPNAFIKFGPTDYWDDVMQLTVPFIDTQRVEPYKPIALSGCGLYHKSTSGSGGFIAPKLIVYDFEPYILDNK